MKDFARLSPTRGTMPTRAPGGKTGSAAGAGFVAARVRSAAANRRRIRIMKISTGFAWSRSEIGRPRPLGLDARSVGAAFSGFAVPATGRALAFVPERIVALAAASGRGSSGNVLPDVAGRGPIVNRGRGRP